MVDVRRLWAMGALAAMFAAAPASAQDEPVAIEPVFVEPAIYLAMFDDADLRGVERPDDAVYDLFIDITGDSDLDGRIRAAAEERGYVRRPVATVGLVSVDGRLLQGPAAEAWTAMKAAARADGISLMMTSAHRDLDAQQSLFRQRLAGRTSDAGIDAALASSAPPGYSKHHSGYAIDIGQAGGGPVGFVNTQAYRWLAEFDFARAKLFGFIPSYPEGGERMGPDPEAWEFVWVGAGRIECGSHVASPDFCDVDANARLDDITWLVDLGVTVGCAPGRFCPDDPITRGEAVSMIWRLHGAPTATVSAPFVDVYEADHFRPAVDWLWQLGVVAGTSADTFSPDDFLRPAEALLLAVRLDQLVEPPPPTGLAGPIPDFGGGPPIVGDLGGYIDRAEFASVLRAAAVS